MNTQTILDRLPRSLRSVLKAGYVELTGLNYRRLGWARRKSIGETWFHNYELLNVFGNDPLLVTLLDRLKDGEVFVDVGAHRGHYTVPVLCSRSCEVFAFEPNPYAYRKLLRNLAANPQALEQSVIQCRNIGLSDGERNEILHLNYPFDGPSTVETAIAEASQGAKRRIVDTVEVTLRPLDDSLPKGVQRIDHIKIDVEGHEDKVLDGAEETIRTHRPTIYLEVHGNGRRVRDRLERFGYECQKIAPEKYVCEAAN
jgi:FkbM family methyltransferase